MLITCPGCGRPLNVPAAAVGKPAHCPHCRAAFDLPVNPDGSPPAPVRRPPRAGMPRVLFGPALGLALLGVAGTFVGGVLAVRFAAGGPAAEADYARTVVRQVRGIEAGNRPGGATGDDWPHGPFAAVLGAGPTVATGETIEAAAADQLAAAWAPSVAPVNTASLVLSVLTLAGGAALLSGRFYWLALAGCLAAAVNVNHLCCLPGGVLGVWGALGLARDDGRAYFRR